MIHIRLHKLVEEIKESCISFVIEVPGWHILDLLYKHGPGLYTEYLRDLAYLLIP